MTDPPQEEWTTEDWVRKLRQQAEDSRLYRHRLYEKVDLRNRKRILDVGCGTGAVTMDIALNTDGQVTGIDIDRGRFAEAERVLSSFSNVSLMEGDVQDLPFGDGTFDLVVFNIVLVYIRDQQRAVDEMARVTEKDGIVLATLEPDYEKRIDYPDSPYAPLILEQMKGRGADLCTGRKLKYLFTKAGLETEIGMDTETDDYILSKDDGKLLESFTNDFWVFEKLFRNDGWSEERIEAFRLEEKERIESGLSFHFTPCFYAIGKKRFK